MNRPNRAKLPEMYMKVLDPKKIVKLMVIQDVTQRQLAEAVWGKGASHSYLGRVLRGDVTTGFKPEVAARIAHFFGVGIDDLFVTRLSTDTAQTGRRRSTAA